MAKMSASQVDLLDFLASTDVQDITDERVVKVLERLGLAERHVPDAGAMRGRDIWRITPEGRRVHAETVAKRMA